VKKIIDLLRNLIFIVAASLMNRLRRDVRGAPRASKLSYARGLMQSQKQLGFSLLEIILALSILGTIGIMTINILSDQIATRQKLSELNTDQHSLNAALNRISQDLQSAYISNPQYNSSLNLANRTNIPKFVSNDNKLSFFTMSFLSILNGSNQSNQAFVKYFTQIDPNDINKKQLIRTVDTDFVDDIDQDNVGSTQVLLDNISEFTVSFWNGSDYQNNWDSKSSDTMNKLPKLVKIHLATFASERRSQIQTKQNTEKTIYSLDTIVFLNNTQEQKEVQTPSWSDFKWQ
jgi:general secretion pathway protein J